MDTINKQLGITTLGKKAVRDRILDVASELFYSHGYRATGINEIIAEAGVAKASFYHHFPSKEALCIAFLKQRNDEEFEEIQAFVLAKRTPMNRYLAVIDALGPWLEQGGFRGCIFLNMISEFPDPDSRARQLGTNHYERLRELVLRMTMELMRSDPQRYANLDARKVADEYLVIMTGAISLAALRHSPESLTAARRAVERLIA